MLRLNDILKYIYNALKVDYIVEQGTSGAWTYRKWKSGISECWGGYKFGTMSVTTANGGAYISAGTPGINLPSGLFTSIKSPFVAEANNGIVIRVTQVTCSSTRVTFKIESNISRASISPYVYFHIKGSWK